MSNDDKRVSTTPYSLARDARVITWSRLISTFGVPVALVVVSALLTFAGTEYNKFAAKMDEMINKLGTLSTNIAVNQGRLDRLERDVQTILNTRYTSSDAFAAQKVQTEIDANQNFRIERLEDAREQ